MSSLIQKSEQETKTWETQKSWVTFIDKKHKTHEQQLTTWETQKAWVALPKKMWAGNKNMTNLKVMSKQFSLKKQKLMSNKWQHEKLKSHEQPESKKHMSRI